MKLLQKELYDFVSLELENVDIDLETYVHAPSITFLLSCLQR